MEEITEMQKTLKEQTVNPRDLKMKLAYDITEFFHGESEALKASDEFKRVVQKGGLPKGIKEFKVFESTNAVDMLMKLELCKSKSEAKRLIEQGGVEVDGRRVNLPMETIQLRAGMVVRAGKKGFARIA